MTQNLEPDGYYRYPDIHGDLVAFVAEDDVWLAPVAGGRAWRVSADQVEVERPRFSPDGSLLAWASRRDGAPEVHVAPVDGGPARRLTYWGNASTRVLGWTRDGEVLAASGTGRMSRAHVWAYAVPLDGGPARELPFGRVADVAFEPDGGDRVLLTAGRMNREPAHWKRYRGGSAGKLWLGTVGGFARAHTELDGRGNIDSPLWVGERIAFLSDHEGVGQLYSSLPDGSDLRRHTDGEFYARNAATDGVRVVYHAGGDLYLLDGLGADARPRRLDVRLGGPRNHRNPHPVSAARYLGEVSVDQDGRASVLEVRGTVHQLPHRDGPARVLAATPGVRHRLPRALPDGGAVWVTDAGGEDALEFTDGRRLFAGEVGRVEALEVSPDGRRLALSDRDGRVLLVSLPAPEPTPAEGKEADAASAESASEPEPEPDEPKAEAEAGAEPKAGAEAEAGAEPEAAITEPRLDQLDDAPEAAEELAFSPDSKWLVWSRPVVLEGNRRQLMLAHVPTREVHQLTGDRFLDHSPVFTTDGKHLAFLSLRDFDPVYDEHVFDLSFPAATRPFLLTLAADTLSPFGPQPGGRPVKPPKEEGKDGDGPTPTRIDLDGLADRIVPFPVPVGRYHDLQAVEGGVVWLDSPVAGVLGNGKATPEEDDDRALLQRFDFANRRVDTLVDALDGYAVSGDGSRLVVLDHGELTVVPADRRAGDDDRVRVDLGRIRVTVDPAAEWPQMFDETARLMKQNFWRIDLGGIDWDAVQARYRPLVARVGSHSDLVDLLWELQGEPGTSHAYVTPPGSGVPAARRLGLLGADISRDPEGSWRVDRVLPGESSDPQARSPLGAPGVAVRPGDAITAVDGVPVDAVAGPGPLLLGTAGKPVALTVAPADGGEARTVAVVPVATEEPLRYHAWVAAKRAYVREASGGRLGYLHVPDMVGNGWAQLHRDLRTELEHEGLLVDTRENRGGHTSQLVIEKLSRKVIGWDLVRDRGSARYPSDAPRGPLVALADEWSGSDGDIVNAAFQAYRLGPVVGTRTWGGVIGIDSRYSLVDGTGITQPRYSMWIEGYGWGVENHGVDPDVEVVITPQDWAAGRDPQLDEAIRLALAALAETPAAQPPTLPPL